ncbi:MAG: hypothetical protein AAGA58_09520 [Verrucomicrobiota bacterium]
MGSQAAVIHSGVKDLSVPSSPAGIFINLETETTSSSFPSDFYSTPSINPFFGGTQIGTSAELQPVLTELPSTPGEGQIANLPLGTVIDASGVFTGLENGSSTHTGLGLGQFQPGVPGYIGFYIEPGPSSDRFYGWMRLTVESGSPGTVHEWAIQSDPGVPVLAGLLQAVPEPSSLVLLYLSLILVLRRARMRKESHSSWN